MPTGSNEQNLVHPSCKGVKFLNCGNRSTVYRSLPPHSHMQCKQIPPSSAYQLQERMRPCTSSTCGHCGNIGFQRSDSRHRMCPVYFCACRKYVCTCIKNAPYLGVIPSQARLPMSGERSRTSHVFMIAPSSSGPTKFRARKDTTLGGREVASDMTSNSSGGQGKVSDS